MPRREAYDRQGDLELMRGVAARDADAMQALFDRHAHRVLASCLRILGQRSEAEDVLESVFLELWQHPDRFDGARGDARAYLELLARSRALDLLRARARAERRVGTAARLGALGDAEAGCDTALSEVLQRERQRRLRRAVDALDEPQRRVVEMSFFEGLSHSRIAEALGLPLGTVKARMRAALRILRRMLSAQDAEGGGDS